MTHPLIPRSSPRRNGKIARLPQEIRDRINHLLDDGFTYKRIIEALGGAGVGLNLQNLCNWFRGGYQEWLRSQELTERTKAYTEHAIELLRQTGAVDPAAIVQASHVVGAAQLLEVMMDRGEGVLKKMLAENPQDYIRIMNLVCRLANSGLRSKKRSEAARQTREPLKPNQPQSS